MTKKTPAPLNTGIKEQNTHNQNSNNQPPQQGLMQLIEDYLYNARYTVNRKSEVLNENNDIIPRPVIVTDIKKFTKAERPQVTEAVDLYLYNEGIRVRTFDTEPRLLDTSKLTPAQMQYLKLSTNRVYMLDDDDRHYYYLIQYAEGYWGIDFTLNPKFRRIKKSNYIDIIKSHINKEWEDMPPRTWKNKTEEKAAKEGFIRQKMREIEDLRDPACVDYFPWQPPTLSIHGTYYLNKWEAPEWYRITHNHMFQRESPLAIPENMSELGQQCLAVFDIIPDEFQRAVVFMWIAKSIRQERNLKALCLFSKATKIGKSTIVEYIIKALHGKGFIESSIKKLTSYNFESGRVANKTCLYLSEAHLSRQDVNYVKTLITSDNWSEDIKNVQSEEDIQKTFNLCLTANPTKDGDLYSILPSDDQAIMGRVIIPKLDESEKLVGRFAPIPSDRDHRFSRETIRKIAGMGSTKANPSQEQRVAVVELATYFRKFEEENKYKIDIENPEISGFLDKEDSMEAFSATLTNWKKSVFVQIAHQVVLNPVVVRKFAIEWYVVHPNILKGVQDLLNDDPIFLAEFNKERSTHNKSLNQKIIRGLFSDNDEYLSYTHSRNHYEGLLHQEAFDLFMDENNITKPTPTDSPPDGAGNPPASDKPADEGPKVKLVEVIEKPKFSTPPKYCYIDFEYQDKISHIDLVCCVLKVDNNPSEKFWFWGTCVSLHSIKPRLLELKDQGVTFVPFCAYLAEARCFLALGFDRPFDFQWLDPYILGLPFYRNPETHRKRRTSDKPLHDKMQNKSMLSMLNYFCGKSITEDKAYKAGMIQRILALKPGEPVVPEEKDAILSYCESDITYLPQLLKAQLKKIREATEMDKDTIEDNFMRFSKHAVQMAVVSSYGIPFNRDVYEDFIQNYAKYVEDEIKKCPMFWSQKKNNKTGQLEYVADTLLFEDFLRKHDLYQAWPKTSGGKAQMTDEVFEPYIEAYIQKSIAFTAFVKSEGIHDQIPKTAKGNVDRSQEALQQLPDGIRDYVLEGFGWDFKDDLARYALCRKEKSGRGAFNPANPEGIDKSVANNADGWLCQFPNLGVYGTKTGRNHPGGKSCVLQSAKHLSNQLILPPPGHTLLQADFEKQEIWIAAALSGDKVLLDDVLNTDVYLTLGISCGMLPPNATKKTHGKDRAAFKTAFIGWFYGAGPATFAEQAGITLDQAEIAMDKMSHRYKSFVSFRAAEKRFYTKKRHLMLHDGWFLASEEFANTVGNFPIQGSGAMLLRKIVDLALERSVRLIYTLHDEFGILCPTEEVEISKCIITDCMQDACKFYFPNLVPCGVEFKPLRSNG